MSPTVPPIFSTPPQRILIIKPSSIGDIVHALPVLNLLRQRWPNAHITWLVNSAYAGLLQNHPQLNDLILFDRKRFGSSWWNPTAAGEMTKFHSSLRSYNFDLVIDLQGLFRSGWLTWRTHAPIRVGSTDAREFSEIFYTHRAHVHTRKQHAIERYLTVAEFLGLGRAPVDFVFADDEADRQFIDTLLPAGKPIAVLLPATNWPTKQWPIERFAQLLEPLREKFGLQPVVAGGADAQPLAQKLPGAIDLTAKTTLRQLVALLRRADLVIANDTGPMHIAAALGRPLVSMFGPTSPQQTGPYDRMNTVIRLDVCCSPCFNRHCSHQSCLRLLPIDPILQMAQRQLALTHSAQKTKNESSPV